MIATFIVCMIAILALCGSLLKFVLDESIDPDFFAVVIEATVPEHILESYTTQIGHHDSDAGLAGGGGQYSNWAVITVYLIPAGRRDETSEPIMQAVRDKIKVIKEKSGFHSIT